MGLFNKYSISILLVTIGSLANAELFNYDYVDLKAGTTSSKAGDREYSLEVSKSIHKNIALKGAVHYTYGDWHIGREYKEQTQQMYTIEGIYHKSILPSTDVLISSGYSNTNGKVTCVGPTGHCTASSSTYSGLKAYGASLGIRQMLPIDIEAEFHYGIVKPESFSNLKRGYLGLMKNFKNNISIGVSYEWNITGSEYNESKIAIRRSF